MKLPIFIHYNEDLDSVEDRWRKSVRKDRLISKSLESIAVMLFEHTAGAVGVMYEAKYRAHDLEYKAALDALGFRLVRTVQMLTRHARVRRIA